MFVRDDSADDRHSLMLLYLPAQKSHTGALSLNISDVSSWKRGPINVRIRKVVGMNPNR